MNEQHHNCMQTVSAQLARAMDTENLTEILARVNREVLRVQGEISELEERLRRHRARWLTGWWQTRREAFVMITVDELYPSSSRGRPACIGERYTLSVLVLSAASQQYTLCTHSATKRLLPGFEAMRAEYTPEPLAAAIRRAATESLARFACRIAAAVAKRGVRSDVVGTEGMGIATAPLTVRAYP